MTVVASTHGREYFENRADCASQFSRIPARNPPGTAQAPGARHFSGSDWNERLTPQTLRIGGGVEYLPGTSERELAVDATLPSGTNNFNKIMGGWVIRGQLKPNRTSHLEGVRPQGGNVVFLDGHIEWRKFPRMVVRTTGEPEFWW